MRLLFLQAYSAGKIVSRIGPERLRRKAPNKSKDLVKAFRPKAFSVDKHQNVVL